MKSVRVGVVLAVLASAAVVWGYTRVRLTPDQIRIHPGLILYSSDRTLLHAYLSDAGQLVMPAPLSNIHPRVIDCVVAAEDKRFFRHAGVDPLALLRACRTNVLAGRVRSGASTLTMQLARLCDPRPRTLTSKLIEMVRAVQLERAYSKSKILELYLNRLPFGGNVVGIEAASRIYFGKSAENLSWEEAALLAGIPKNPSRYHPLKSYEAALARKNHVVARLRANGIISEDDLRRLTEARPPAARRPIPFYAPHFCEWVRQKSGPAAFAGPLQTTLDLELQLRVEAIVSDAVKLLKPQNIQNVSVVVIDNSTRGVLSYVGSHDFFDPVYDGQVQGPLAVRSPGSALKPFLTILALENGHVTPLEKLVDVPTHYIGLDPENFYRDYEGLVSVRDALSHSLNIPAVRLLEQEGAVAFKNFLDRNEFRRLERPAAYYGLGLVLGGCGVTLLELTQAYAALASGGEFRPVAFSEKSLGRRDPVRIYSAESAYLVSEMLKAETGRGGMVFAFKTGTSANHKDAWCVGWTPSVTVGVWCGNFSGESSRFLVGRSAALPLVEKILRASSRDPVRTWYVRPSGLGRRPVCALSGRPATAFCPSLVKDDYVPGRTKNHACQIHARMLVSDDGRYQLCAGCIAGHGGPSAEGDRDVQRSAAGRPYRAKRIERYPPEVAAFFASRGMTPSRVAPHDPDCPVHQTQRNEIQILSPADRDKFHSDPATRVPIKAASSRPDEELYVFVDDALLGKLTPKEVTFYRPTPGPHRLLVVDSSGGSASLRFDVVR